MKSRGQPPKAAATAQSVLEMTSREARRFFLKQESYCRIDLPPYFNFGRVLGAVAKALGSKPVIDQSFKPEKHENVNYTIYSNKDGRYAWRPFQLIHPVLYVNLVNVITEPARWQHLQARFTQFAADEKISCLSIPQESLTVRKDQGAQVLHWWEGIEQASIELALDFRHVFHADISDCYSSIYTHSVAWAVHEKSTAKEHKSNKSLDGNVIDACIRGMQHGQTNGIPQGSVLLDFVAELVLGYADLHLSRKLATSGIENFKILRYRDDYRVFVNNPRHGEAILKSLTEVLLDLGLKLSASKTTDAEDVIASSIKVDKREWMRGRRFDRNLQKHLLLIHHHGIEHPNAGSLVVALDEFYNRLSRAKSIRSPMQLISIAVDIGYASPRCFPVCTAIVSELLGWLPCESERLQAVKRIHARLRQLPNNGHLEVWLQRLTLPITRDLPFDERLCEMVAGTAVELWESSWITDPELRDAASPRMIISKPRLRKLSPIVDRKEFALFFRY